MSFVFIYLYLYRERDRKHSVYLYTCAMVQCLICLTQSDSKLLALQSLNSAKDSKNVCILYEQMLCLQDEQQLNVLIH